MRKTREIVLKISEAWGDTILATRVLKAIDQRLHSRIKVKVSSGRRIFLEGLVNQRGGFNGELVESSYIPSSSEFQVDISDYLDMPSNRNGINYSETILQLVEEQIGKQIGVKNFRLPRDVKAEIRFDEKKYEKDIETGRKKVEELKTKYGKKPIIWLGATTAGSKNRMPQNCKGKEDFWQELCDRLKEKVVFYELRARNTKPICGGIEPLEGESFSFVAESEVIKASSAGVGVEGMHVEWAYALGKPKMIVLVGPTHPAAKIYPEAKEIMLTIPSIEEVKAYKNKCWGCGNLGYSTFVGLEESRKVMTRRFPKFQFDSKTERALESKDNVALNNAKVKCRKLKQGEHLYDCWDGLSTEKVANQIEKLIKK